MDRTPVGTSSRPFTTLVEVLQLRADQQPDRQAFSFLANGEEETARLTYRELDLQARTVAAALQQRCRPGQRALLLYPPGLNFVVAFFGCLYAGVVAVPAYPPRPGRDQPRLRAIFRDAESGLALTEASLGAPLATLASRLPDLGGVEFLATDSLPGELAAGWRQPDLGPESIAFLQYTSGSTSAPRGVIVRHGDLLANEEMIRRAFGQDESSVVVGWLPLYHDMGLIGNVLQPLYVGGTCHLMSPVAFLQQPQRWLSAISRFRGTTSGGPDFAYALCADKVTEEARAGLDLSSWQVAFNGAEPVRSATLERFAAAFAPCGFRREAFYPCYGLAEATLFVSGGSRPAPPRVDSFDPRALEENRAERVAPGQGQTLVGNGWPWMGQQVRIVDPERRIPLPAGQVGEIWVAGPCVSRGYWNRPEETQHTFGARLADGGEESFLRTGDLGFLADDPDLPPGEGAAEVGGELFVTGRLKDLIIIRGRNLYPQDIEATAEASHPAVRTGCSAAFSVEVNGQERLVVVAEVRSDDGADLGEVMEALRRTVAEEHEVQVHAVELLGRGTIPKTSSGKIQRHACRQAFLAGARRSLARSIGEASPGAGYVPPRNPGETTIARLWEELFGVRPVGIEDNFFALGGDSLLATRLLGRLNETFGVELSLDAVFDAPTVAAQAVLVAVRRDAGEGAVPPISRVAREGDSPLSFAQQRLWFLHQMEPDNPVHNIAAIVHLEGALNRPALGATFGEICRRHEVLRSRFPGGSRDEAGPQGALQRVDPPSPRFSFLPVVDLSHLAPGQAPGQREGAVRALARRGARRPFDLERGPVLRPFLLATDEGSRHELVIALHHVVADGWSLEVLTRELSQIYTALHRNSSSTLASLPLPESILPDLPVQYADFAAWQRRFLDAEILDRQLLYWREELAGPPPPLELPGDRPRPPRISHRGAHLVRHLPASVGPLLRHRGAELDATPFMLLLAVFQALLGRHAGQDDFAVGSPIASRRRPELEGLIGFFVNTLVLRAELGDDPPFRELLARVRRSTLAAFAHQDVPFERLVDALAPERDLSRSPLFQVMLVLQNAPRGAVRLPGVVLRPRELDLGTARFDLALNLAEGGGGEGEPGTAVGRWLGTWKYSTDLFDATTLERLAGHFHTLMEAALTAPETRLRDLPLLSPGERHQLLVAWNDTAGAFPAEATLADLLDARAEASPEALALLCEGPAGDEHLSYRELADRARRLARRLAGMGVGRDDRVGVLMERSADLLVALHGTVRAGAAYVPLDPEAPRERLATMLGDALEGQRARVLLTQPELLERAPELPRLEVLPSIREGGGEGAGAFAVEPTQPLPESLAYVIYTSGSTGKPKGVMVPHRGIVHRLGWMQAAYPLDGSDRVLQKTPYTFDVSVWELFWPFLVGAPLVVARPGGHKDAAYLVRLIARRRVTTLHFVPSMLQVFLREEGRREEALEELCRPLRRVIASGEALPAELVERFFERFPGRGEEGPGLHNLYGPTEASVDVTAWACQPRSSEDEGIARLVPIGRPIANTRIHLLDRRLEPVPIGVAGELFIGGVQLARGYLARPGRTAGTLVPLPEWGEEPGGRLYRSGDLARHRPDGAVEFLGRLDFQVKVRGVRIELGEVEAALLAHPAVQEAVAVMLPGRGSESGRLGAYLVGEGEELGVSALRRFLAERLPEAAIPGVFVLLSEMPLSPNGKVNRRALPAPDDASQSDAARLKPGGEFVPPRDALEEHLARAWQQQLGVARVGRDDDFFTLGGDSIQGALLINRLQRELGETIYVMALFEAPSVARLAALLRERYPEGAARLAGEEAPPSHAGEAVEPAANTRTLLSLRRFLAEWRPLTRAGAETPPWQSPPPKNPPAIFLLSPFRSGSTLLRVMLAGHPALFAPPELELLPYNTLGQRARRLSGPRAFSREGLLRAVMEIQELDADGARALLAEHEEADETVAFFYRRLQEWIHPRLLVDKTPSYALQLGALRRAEEIFDGALYVHLSRHPQAMVRSYLAARFDQIYEFPLPPRQAAEGVWTVSHQNILTFLAEVPRERQLHLPFEELLADSEGAMRRLADFLGIEFHPTLLEPYSGGRMTDGLHAETRMMGDPKFHQHRRIEPQVAEAWRREGELPLGPLARQLAWQLGYREGGETGKTAVGETGAREIPLSLAQQRLWFLATLEPRASAYNMPAAVRLRGRLDRLALGQAFTTVVRRHGVLRSRFPHRRSGPVQVVEPPRPVPLPRIDLAALGEEIAAGESSALARRFARRPFDLATGQLLRLALVELPEVGEKAADEVGSEALLLVNLHHIVADGWSVGVLIEEVSALYEAGLAGDPSPLPELPLQYADWAEQQQRWLAGGEMEAQLAWWRERLGGLPPALDLPADRPRPAQPERRGALVVRRVDGATTGAVRDLARRRGVTLFTVLLATFEVLLARYTGETDLAVGTPAANRGRGELEGLIGFFVNTLVVRTDAGGDPPFLELLERVRQAVLGAFTHQDVPFEKLVEVLAGRRDVSRSPLFQVMLVLQSMPVGTLELPGLVLERLALDNGAAKFDWNLGITELDPQKAGGQDGLELALEYSSELFEATTALRASGHFAALLGAVTRAPESPLSALSLLSPGEHHQVLAEWNDTAARLATEGFSPGATLADLLAARAERCPEALALLFEAEEEGEGGDEHLSYGELASRAGRLARQLRHSGVGRDDRVALLMERSVELLVAVHGIVAAGGAYVPLDTTSPAERLVGILEDARVTVVLSQPRLLERPGVAGLLRQLPGLEILPLAPGWGASDPRPAGRELGRPAQTGHPVPESLAYVIYTSGSTGKPKGVMVPHRGIVYRLDWMQAAYPLDGSDRVLQKTPYTFDVSVWELFWPFLVGAALVVARPEGHRDAGYLTRLIARQRVTTLHFVPSMLQIFLREEGLREHCLSLRRVIASGEALPAELVERFYATLRPEAVGAPREGGAELHNLYGPTEASVDVTAWPCSQAPPGRRSALPPVPIGRPVPNTGIYLLDRRGEPVPIGVPGELFIGGVQLARGYLARPARTAATFVPLPAWSRELGTEEPGGRLYRTGDLTRFRPDGAVEFLGRLDFQVKVRGVRIELGEVEAALLAHPMIRETVVVAHPEGGGRLIAYLVGKGDSLEVSELRRFLGRQLPEVMIPAVFVPLAEMPLSSSGKVSRRALPEPEGARPELAAAFVAPEGGLEETIATIWQRVLGLDRVGLYDNFFDLGGHSLLLAEVHERLGEALGREVAMVELFQHTTVDALARHLAGEAEQARAGKGEGEGEGTTAGPAAEVARVQEEAQRQKQALERRKRRLKSKSKRDD